jgi:4-amino-4-deoxy-L-arabinose transferase-like glycosyltransferase
MNLPISRSLLLAWWAAIAALLGLHFVHLSADFPNFSAWMDYSKYTDEGWYGNAAIRQALFHHWRFPGDFNPAVALPVWPLLLRAAFAIGGVKLVVARTLGLVIFAADLLLSYAILRRAASPLVAMAGVTMLAASAFLWAFTRLAILEPLQVLFLLLGWLAVLHLDVSRLGEADGSDRGDAGQAHGRRNALLLGAGLTLALGVLTKTTSVVLIPSTFYLLWHTSRFVLRRTIADGATIAAGGLVPWGAYYLLVLLAHYHVDYHYLFAANDWVQPTTVSGWFWAFWYALHGTLWIDPKLCGLAVGVLLLSLFAGLVSLREPGAIETSGNARATHALIGASLLAIAGSVFFSGWHNSPQPRYYEVVAYPVVFLACLGAVSLSRSRQQLLRWTSHLAWVTFAVIAVLNLRSSVYYASHPQYTLLSAAQALTRYIDQHPNGNRLLLSISGDQITLMTHLPAICDDFGTVDLPYRIHQYQPGWYAEWNEMDPGTLEDLQTQYSLEKVAEFPALDDEDRNVLILYKMHPLPADRQNYEPLAEAEANQGQE